MARCVAHYNLQHVGEPRQNDLETGTVLLQFLFPFILYFLSQDYTLLVTKNVTKNDRFLKLSFQHPKNREI